MICCKIISDFTERTVSLSKLLKTLGSLGWLIWDGQNIYFANTDSYEVGETKVKSTLRKCGVKSFYIQVYSKESDLKEKEDTSGWIIDKLIKINYKLYEDRSQEVFRDILKGLDMLDEEIHRIESQENQLKNNMEEAECIEQEKT